jgi:hypothetical protein
MATILNTVETKELLEIIKGNAGKMVEARILINRFFCATHFFYFKGKRFYNEGIDGENRVQSQKYFLNFYRNNYWLVDNII